VRCGWSTRGWRGNCCESSRARLGAPAQLWFLQTQHHGGEHSPSNGRRHSVGDPRWQHIRPLADGRVSDGDFGGCRLSRAAKQFKRFGFGHGATHARLNHGCDSRSTRVESVAPRIYNVDTYWSRLKPQLDAKGWRLQDLADRLGVSFQAVAKVRDGGAFGSANNIKAAKLLDVTPEWLATGTGPQYAAKPDAAPLAVHQQLPTYQIDKSAHAMSLPAFTLPVAITN
jgi:transcriptional regulator with XRE-family HTH domain